MRQANYASYHPYGSLIMLEIYINSEHFFATSQNTNLAGDGLMITLSACSCKAIRSYLDSN